MLSLSFPPLPLLTDFFDDCCGIQSISVFRYTEVQLTISDAEIRVHDTLIQAETLKICPQYY